MRSKSANELMNIYVQTQSERAFTVLYDMYSDKLYYFLLVMSSADTAADICQKTWMKILENKHKYQDRNNFQAWLYTLGRRALIDELRQQNKLVYDTDLIESTEHENNFRRLDGATINTQNIEYNCSNCDSVELFHTQIQRLPFKQREALSLQLDGFSLKDIATICHSSPETVKTRLRYARTALKHAMEITDEIE